MSIIKTLTERGCRYGSFEDNAIVTSGLMDVIEQAPRYNDLSPVHVEALHMIFHKISRMVCGDPDYSDNAHDIIGYATKLEEYLLEMGK
jgi:hypothetical protein